jgi:hypothetical protein
MKRLYICFLFSLLCFTALNPLSAQEIDSVDAKELGLSSILNGIRQQQINDSLERVKLQNEITNLKTQNSSKKENLKQQLNNLDEENFIRNQEVKLKVDSEKYQTLCRCSFSGYPFFRLQ